MQNWHKTECQLWNERHNEHLCHNNYIFYTHHHTQQAIKSAKIIEIKVIVEKKSQKVE